MKRLIAIPLLLLYCTAVSGMIVRLHYCGGALSAWAVNAKETSCCCERNGNGSTSVLKDDDCCSDKTITFKISQDQYKASSPNQLSFEAFAQLILPVVPSVPAVAIRVSESAFTYQANAPPGLWQNIPLYKLHARFTYYG